MRAWEHRREKRSRNAVGIEVLAASPESNLTCTVRVLLLLWEVLLTETEMPRSALCKHAVQKAREALRELAQALEQGEKGA